MPEAYEEHYSSLRGDSGDMVSRELVHDGSDRDGGVLPYGTGEATAPVLIPGTGTSMGTPFIKRRPRPLTMRLTIILVLACLLTTGLISATPLSATPGGNSMLQVLSGAVDVNQQVSYHWYIAQSGDDLD